MNRQATSNWVKPGRDPVTGEPKVAEKEGVVLRSQALRVAAKWGWQADDGPTDSLTQWQELHFTKHDGETVPIVALFDRKGRCQAVRACLPQRLLLLLAGSCTCEGFVRTGPWEDWRQLANDVECPVHFDSVKA